MLNQSLQIPEDLKFMSECSIIENPPANLWRPFLSRFEEGNFEQCFEYGEIAEMAFPRTKAVRLAVSCDGRIVGVVQGAFSSYFGFGMDLGVMHGPIVDTKSEEGLQFVEALLKELEGYGKRNRIIHAQVSVSEAWQLQEVFHRMGYTSTGRSNEYVVNLGKGMDELWKSITHNKRRNIKKARKEGVEVIQSRNHEDLLTFYSMLEAAEKRGGFSSYPLSWFEAVWEIYDPELSRVFLARWKGEDVSGVFTVIHGKTVYALAAGSFRGGWKVRPNDIMHWKIMEWASKNDYSRYQMGIVSEPPPTEGSSAWGIWRWKREWKGSLEKIQIFDKMFLPKYKLILKSKKLIERGYTRLGQLR